MVQKLHMCVTSVWLSENETQPKVVFLFANNIPLYVYLSCATIHHLQSLRPAGGIHPDITADRRTSGVFTQTK